MDDLRYPIGRFQHPASISQAERDSALAEIAALPNQLRSAVDGWSAGQLDTPYRPDGWTVRQVLHHVADSHLNNYVRCRLALTEEEPTIKGYDEGAWAKLEDARSADVKLSLDLLDNIHQRLVLLLRSLTDEQWQRTFRHSERGLVRLDNNLALYAWHGKHHLAHITRLRERSGWQ